MTTTEAAPTLTFDMDAITTRMLIDFRTATGVSLLSFVDDKGDLNFGSIPEEALGGVIWLAMRTSGQTEATYEEALDTPFSLLDINEQEAAAPADPS